MDIHYEKLTDVERYIQNNKHKKLEDLEPRFNRLFKYIGNFKSINGDTKILEIGIGTGWLPILCKKKGISCKGIEISPQLIEFALNFGQKFGIEPDVELGNIEESNIGISEYDIIIAHSVFEHVEYWQKGLKRVYDALTPGGLFYFSSTNKFYWKSGEYDYLFYNWLPDSWRYQLRISRQGPDIMKLGVDFNQFNPFQLRRFLKKLGFSMVMCRAEFLNPENLSRPTPGKRIFLKILKRSRVLKNLSLLFEPGTMFMCIK